MGGEVGAGGAGGGGGATSDVATAAGDASETGTSGRAFLRDVLGFFGAFLAGADVAERFLPFLSSGVGAFGAETGVSAVVSEAGSLVGCGGSGAGTTSTLFCIGGDGGLSEISLSATGLAITDGDGCSGVLSRVGLAIEDEEGASVWSGIDAAVGEL